MIPQVTSKGQAGTPRSVWVTRKHCRCQGCNLTEGTGERRRIGKPDLWKDGCDRIAFGKRSRRQFVAGQSLRTGRPPAPFGAVRRAKWSGLVRPNATWRCCPADRARIGSGCGGPTAPLTGPEALDFGALARIAAEVTGRQIRQEVLTDAELRGQAGARAAGSGRGSYDLAPGGVLPAADHAGPDFSRPDRLDRVASDQVQGRYALVQGDEGERPHVQHRAKPAGMGRHGKATKAEKAPG